MKYQLIPFQYNRSGDADIYVSQTTTKPTYEPDNYCLQSTTCGEDIIYIPERLLFLIIPIVIYFIIFFDTVFIYFDGLF